MDEARVVYCIVVGEKKFSVVSYDSISSVKKTWQNQIPAINVWEFFIHYGHIPAEYDNKDPHPKYKRQKVQALQ